MRGNLRRLPRLDVEKAVTVHRKPVHISEAPEEQYCLLCSREWFQDSEYACQLKCGHWLCLECVIRRVDEAGNSPFRHITILLDKS
jgi:hypothetical protein